MEKREKDKRDREMSRLKKGDIIECFNHDELEITEEGLTNDGYGFVETYDMTTMKWKIRITEVREAKKNILTDMTDEELADHYYDMAHLPLTPDTKEHDVAFFHDVVMEMAARFARTVQEKRRRQQVTENRIKTYEKLLGYILILAVILGIVSQLTGCGEYFNEESRVVIDYRYAEGHTEIWTKKTDKGEPYYEYYYVGDKYELLWLVTYQDGHTERHWEECTRFEYNNARKELGDIEDGSN